MKTHIVSIGQLIALVLVATLCPELTKAQTVISNETLVATTFVVNKTAAAAICGNTGCTAKVPMLSSIPVTCPAAIGKTCTFHIQLDAKVEISFPCESGCFRAGPETSFQFLVDGSSPSPGPVEGNGYYLFSKSVFTYGELTGEPAIVRQSYPASLVSTVTNGSSNDHTVEVNLNCKDMHDYGGCEAVAHFSTMRIDVFEP